MHRPRGFATGFTECTFLWACYKTGPLAEWRNWQTRRIQNPVSARTCRFESDLGY